MLAVLWLAMVPLVALWYTQHTEGTEPIGIHVVPEVPREGEPMLVSFPVRNPSKRTATISYELHANGRLMGSGTVTLPPRSAKLTQYAYRSDVPRGERITFVARATSEDGAVTKTRSLPSYPSQVWSSFSSFSAFSSAALSSLTDTAYFRDTFDTGAGVNLGIGLVFTLIGLLVFLELSQPMLQRSMPRLAALWPRYRLVSTVLLLVLAGIVYTRIMFVLEAA